MNIYRKKTGFTLIELLVVTTIIIVLATIGMVSFTSASKSARDSKRKADMETIRQALMLSKQQTGSYPLSYESLAGTYLSEPVPRDPLPSGTYTYTQSSGCICAVSEVTKGNSNNATCTSWNTSNTGTHICAKGL